MLLSCRAQKAAIAIAGIAVIVLGVKAVQKKREDDSAEGQAKNTAQKVGVHACALHAWRLALLLLLWRCL